MVPASAGCAPMPSPPTARGPLRWSAQSAGRVARRGAGRCSSTVTPTTTCPSLVPSLAAEHRRRAAGVPGRRPHGRRPDAARDDVVAAHPRRARLRRPMRTVGPIVRSRHDDGSDRPAPAARQLATLVRGVTDEQLDAPTPCPEYTVGDLLDHIGGLAKAFTWAATKESLARCPTWPERRRGAPRRRTGASASRPMSRASPPLGRTRRRGPA